MVKVQFGATPLAFGCHILMIQLQVGTTSPSNPHVQGGATSPPSVLGPHDQGSKSFFHTTLVEEVNRGPIVQGGA